MGRGVGGLACVVAGLTIGCGLVWRDVRSEEGGFSVRMPGPPEKRLDEVEGPDGRPLVVNWLTVALGKRIADVKSAYYMAGYSTLEGVAPSLETFAHWAVGRLVSGVQGRVTARSTVQVAGLPAEEIEIEAENETWIRARIFLVGRTGYQLIVGGSRELVRDPADGGTFLNSFTLLEEPP